MAKKKRRKGSNRREMICISAVVLVLLGAVFVQGNRLRQKNREYEEKVVSLSEQIAQESERAAEIEELKEYVNTPEYAGEAAKQKLGMVGEDEILFRAEN
ncbi:MAG: septum formation initiator family protein [Eubacteriales bacterium]|nr:septum formation initiator family protein [Eubacteriales bacterium]